MKSSGSGKNRRVSKPQHRKHQHLLEVSVRRDIARVQRSRAILGYICKTVLVGGLIAGAYVGGKEGLRRFLWENPTYYLLAPEVFTDGALTREQVLNTAGIEEGKNIFTIDLAKAREALDELPQVERVEVQRILPNRINVTITERKPIAWVTRNANEDVTTSATAYLIDLRGIVMRSEKKLPEYLNLPVISGVELKNLALGQRVRSYEMQAALDLIRLCADNVRFQPRNLDLEKQYCVVVTDQLRRKITFGLDGVDEDLARLMRCFDYVESNGKEIQTVNLIPKRNMPVVFAEPQVEEPLEEEAVDLKNGVKDGKTKPSAKKGEATPTPVPAKSRAKESTPAGSKRTPAQSVKKPFRS